MSFGAGANRRKSVMENTKMRMSSPNKPSSVMLARNMLALSFDHVPPFVRVAASKAITRTRRIEANRPTTRNGSVTRKCEQLVQHQKCLGGNRPVTEALPEHLAGVCNRRECRYKKQHGKDGIDNHFGFVQIIAKVDAELLFGHLGSLVESRWFEPLQRQSTTISRLSKSENVDTWPITEKKFPRHCRRRHHLRHRHRQTSAARHGRVGKSQICQFRNTECNTETINVE